MEHNKYIDTDWSTTANDSESTSSDYKTQPIDKKELEHILQSIDDLTHRSKDFQISKNLRKDLNEIIENIKAHKCKLSNIYNQHINMCNKKVAVSKSELIKNSEMFTNNVIKELMRYTDVLGLIYNETADKLLTRICSVIKRITKNHCHNIVPLVKLLKNVEYLDLFILLVNDIIQKSSKKIVFESSSNQLFDEDCCIQFKNKGCEDICVNKDCEYEITNLLKHTATGITPSIIRNKLFSTDRNKDLYKEKLNDDNESSKNFFNDRYKLLDNFVKENARLTSNKGLDGDGAIHDLFINTNGVLKLKEKDNIDFKTTSFQMEDESDYNIKIQLNNAMKELLKQKDFKNIKKHLLDKIKNPFQINTTVLNNLYVTVPCIIHSKELPKCRTVLVIKSFIRLHKYINSYIIYKLIGSLFQQDQNILQLHEVTDEVIIEKVLKSELDENDKEILFHKHNIRFRIIRKIFDDQFRQLQVVKET